MHKISVSPANLIVLLAGLGTLNVYEEKLGVFKFQFNSLISN